jgi:Cys-tRNA(Pro)/Cys-tRNA(Cys) deacylase
MVTVGGLTSVTGLTVSTVAATPAIKAAEAAGVRFSLHEYEHDPGATSYGDEAAEKLGVDPGRLFKTLVVSVDGELEVACVPVSAQLDLKALGKRARMADKGQAQAATGYVSGGTSPLGQRKKLRTHLDESAFEHETVLVNGGRRGLQIELDPYDLERLTDAHVHAIASDR